jgi:hypothetical protein
MVDSTNDHGLALHSTLMAVIGGSLVVESVQGEFTRVELRLPEQRLSSFHGDS